jgi:hypothetical protein
VIDPPPWADGLSDLAAPEPAVTGDGIDALSRMKIDSGDTYDPPASFGPVAVVAPLIRPKIPAPDWRGEQEGD